MLLNCIFALSHLICHWKLAGNNSLSLEESTLC